MQSKMESLFQIVYPFTGVEIDMIRRTTHHSWLPYHDTFPSPFLNRQLSNVLHQIKRLSINAPWKMSKEDQIQSSGSEPNV